MRKFAYTVLGVAAFASASIASAAVTVTSSTGLNSPNPTTAVTTSGDVTTIDFGQNPLANGPFSATFTLNNTLSGLYNIVVQTSTSGVTFDAGTTTLVGPTGAPVTFSFSPTTTGLELTGAPIALAMGEYMFTLNGNNANNGGTFTGNVSITPSAAVPEAKTWAMMILGFGAMGLAIRRRRHPVLAQLA